MTVQKVHTIPKDGPQVWYPDNLVLFALLLPLFFPCIFPHQINFLPPSLACTAKYDGASLQGRQDQEIGSMCILLLRLATIFQV